MKSPNGHSVPSGGTGIVGLVGAMLLALAVVVPLMFTPTVNLEWVFQLGSEVLLGNRPDNSMRDYFTHQANPLGTSLIAAGSQLVLNQIPPLAASRIPSVIGLLAIIFFAWLRPKAIVHVPTSNTFAWWIAFLLSHPLIIPFSFRLTADLIPATCVFGVACLCLKSRLNSWAVAGIPLLLLVSSFTKYNNVLYLGACFVPLVLAQATERRAISQRVLICLSGVVIGMGVLGALIYWQYQTFGVRFVSETFQEMHRPDFNSPIDVLTRFGRYIVFLALLLSPFLIEYLPRFAKTMRSYLWWLLASVGLLVLSVGDDPTNSELDFGGLTTRNSWFTYLALFFGSACAVVMIKVLYLGDLRSKTVALVMIFLPISVMSFSRPSQRYLLPCILIGALILETNLSRSRRAVVLRTLMLLLFSLATLSVVSFQVSTASAAEKMALWIEDNYQLVEVDPGDIYAHAGLRWVSQDRDPLLVVKRVASDFSCSVKHESIRMFFIEQARFCALEKVVAPDD